MNWLSGYKILPKDLHFHCLMKRKGVAWRRGLAFKGEIPLEYTVQDLRMGVIFWE